MVRGGRGVVSGEPACSGDAGVRRSRVISIVSLDDDEDYLYEVNLDVAYPNKKLTKKMLEG
jgi:hypothetical protein